MNEPEFPPSSLSLLMIGPLPPPVGGTRVSFKLLVDTLSKRRDLSLRVISDPPSGRRPLRFLFRFGRELLEIYRHAYQFDAVVLHCNTSALDLKGIPVGWITGIRRKPLIVRTFGGDDFREKDGLFRRALKRKALRRVGLYLAQTQALVERAREELLVPVEWFPTSRPTWDGSRPNSKSCRRFVFLGHVAPGKGIRELIEAGERLGEEVSIDVYGPCREGLSAETFSNLKRVRYRGEVDPDKVFATLAKYDVLALPTYHSGEGYPGAVIEAFQVGLPILCTNWQALPELVDSSCGLLVPPRDPEALYAAMKRLTEDDELFARLREGSRAKGPQFSTEFWTERFVEFCRLTVDKRR